ncbi:MULTISPECIES: hypothetical protein [Empedobacter]|uniref:hypothetical protein n=1 Tax=Empedobacter TaxID=59734 RepID=UPI0025C680A1|nr:MULTISPECIES: hypothetical protein [unclassified Empedobacter]
MTIKNLFAIILKLIGLFFIIFIFTIFIPEQINVLLNMDIFYPGVETFVPFPIITIISILIILFIIYYLTIYRTEIMMKFLRIDKYFGNEKIENNEISISKFVQIGILISSVIILVFNLPEFIKDIITYLSAKDAYKQSLTFIFLGSGITSVLAIILLIFSDKISKSLTK